MPFAKAAAITASTLLPSANMIDGAAKQFDDGLYAAVDLACFRGELGLSPAVPQWVAAVFSHLPAKSPARPFLAAALELGGEKTPAGDVNQQEKAKWLADFEQDKAASKPIGFYTWTPELQRTWRFYRFLQHEFDAEHLAIPRDVAAVLKDHADLLKQYRAINAFYGRLTNPLICLPVDALIDATQDVAALAKQRGASHATVALFPPSTSRETELFERLFPRRPARRRQLDGHADPPHPLGRSGPETEHKTRRRRLVSVSGLRTGNPAAAGPRPGKGQAASDGRVQETARRGIQGHDYHAAGNARKAIAKSAKCGRETVVGRRSVAPAANRAVCDVLSPHRPRVRLLQNFLQSAVGRQRLEKLHGLKQGGTREATLDAELDALVRRFYGFYLLACEDIGMRPQFLPDEPVDQAAARSEALKWLENIDDRSRLGLRHPRFGADRHRSVRGKTRLWATVGVRLAHLDASYARPPRVRPKGEKGEWKEVEAYQLGSSHYVIPVVEFAEFELTGSNALSSRGIPRHLRSVFDQGRDRAGVGEIAGHCPGSPYRWRFLAKPQAACWDAAIVYR